MWLKLEPWKVSLPEYIEELFFKHFKRKVPENVRSIERVVKDKKRKQIEKKERKRKKEANTTEVLPKVQKVLD